MNATLFRDFLFILVLLLVFLVNPPAEPPKPDALEPPGAVIVSIVWPPGDNDVDLWILGPGEEKAVGYTNKTGKVWSLLRDDLGNDSDPFPLNYENAYARGVLAGDYIVNVHCFRCPSGPQEVTIEIATRTPNRGLTRIDIVKIKIANREERTVLRFTLDADGRVTHQNRLSKNLFYKEGAVE